MKKNINEEMKKNLKFYKGKKVKLNQLGFIESEIIFENLEYNNENDILKLYDEKNSIYIKINLNQIYHIENFEKDIIIFLDNDTQIKLSI